MAGVQLRIGGQCPAYIKWKISVGRASVSARTRGGQRRPPHQKINAEGTFRSSL